MTKQSYSREQPFIAVARYRSQCSRIRNRMAALMAIAVALAGCQSEQDFVRDTCDKLGNGIHQKVEEYTTEDGFTNLVIYSLFCGVELRANGDRRLKGQYAQETGYQVKRHWGYLKYTPTPESVKRAAVESGHWEIGTWKTRASGLNNTVVLEEGPKIVNGNWSYCADTPDYQCSEKYR